MSIPKLSFRQPPLRMKIRKPPVKVAPVVDIESQEPVPKSNNRVMYIVAAIVIALLLRMGSMLVFKRTAHTIKKLKCRLRERTISCYGADPIGTFVIDIPDSCSGSVYDIGGYPFSVAKHDKFFKVPDKDLSIKDVNGNCEAIAYIDSNPMTINYPFTWITTNQHTTFTLLDGNSVIVDKVSAELFESTTRGPWIAYTYDIPGRSARVIGDGSDIIHVYNGVSA